jgi:hypothetical protein
MAKYSRRVAPPGVRRVFRASSAVRIGNSLRSTILDIFVFVSSCSVIEVVNVLTFSSIWSHLV